MIWTWPVLANVLTLLASHQKLLCDDRFVGGVGTNVEVLEKQLLSQMLQALRVTPSLHEDLQVEVMKVGAKHLHTGLFAQEHIEAF